MLYQLSYSRNSNIVFQCFLKMSERFLTFSFFILDSIFAYFKMNNCTGLPTILSISNRYFPIKPMQNCGGDWIRTHSVKDTRFTVWPGSPTPAHPLLQQPSQWTDSNPRPADYKSAALPTELHWLKIHKRAYGYTLQKRDCKDITI